VVVENVERHEMVSEDNGKQHEETYFYPRVRFTTATGQPVVFLPNTGSDPPTYQPGDTVTVLYNPANPGDASLKDWSLWFGAGMFLLLGSVFASIGLVSSFLVRRKKSKERWLQSHGTRILADFSSIRHNVAEIVTDSTDIEINSSDTWYIVCQWLNPQTNQIHLFRSEGIQFDPTAFVTVRQIPVTVDPQNFNRYSVDLSFLPALAEKQGFHWKSLISWPKRKLDDYLARWHAFTGTSLDAFLGGFYLLCMMGLLWFNGALSVKMQLLFTGILLFGIIQFSLWQRRAGGWQWPGPDDDLMKTLLTRL
jgi:hypothetical protein